MLRVELQEDGDASSRSSKRSTDERVAGLDGVRAAAWCALRMMAVRLLRRRRDRRGRRTRPCCLPVLESRADDESADRDGREEGDRGSPARRRDSGPRLRPRRRRRAARRRGARPRPPRPPASPRLCRRRGRSATRREARSPGRPRRPAARSSSAAALCADARQEQHGARQQLRARLEQLRDASRRRRPRPRRARSRRRSPHPTGRRGPATCCPERTAVGERQVLEVGAARVRGLHDDEARPSPSCARNGSSESSPRYGLTVTASASGANAAA